MIDFDNLKSGSSNVSLNDYKDVYDESKDRIYRIHTIKTEGEKGEIHTVFCTKCKNEMFYEVETEEFYCPVSNG